MIPVAPLVAALDGVTDPTERHVALLLASCADWRGRVEMGQRDIARVTGRSLPVIGKALDALAQAGIIRVEAQGSGPKPSVYRLRLDPQGVSAPAPVLAPSVDVEPGAAAHERIVQSSPEPLWLASTETAEAPREAPPGHPDPWAFDPPPPPPPPAPARATSPVQDVLAAARVPANTDQPLYWRRHEHRAELDAMLARVGMPLDAALDKLRSARPAGPIRRIRDLEPLLATEGQGSNG